LALVLLAQLSFLTYAEAALIAEWNFDDSNLVADAGTQAGTAGFSTTGGAVSFPPRGGGRALQMAASTNQSYTLALSGTGLSDFQVTYEGLSTPLFIFNISQAQTWSWSTDNVTYSSAGVSQTGALTAGGYSSYSVDFSGVSAIEGAPSVYLRNEIQSGVFGINTNLRFDNVSVSAVPEPSGVMAVMIAIIGIAFLIKKRRKNSPSCSDAS